MKTLINPIENHIINAVVLAENISIAVPFISYVAVNKIFNIEVCEKIKQKRILIKVDDSHRITFDLAAMKHLLECGFEIRFDNNIHLKLYILGKQIFISSGNLTDGGLKNNFELTIETNELEANVSKVFDDIWERSFEREITMEYILDNWSKYKFLKSKFPSGKRLPPEKNEQILSLDRETLIDAVLYEQKDHSGLIKMISKSNRSRSSFLEKIDENGFKIEYFYAPEGSVNRKKSLFYNFVYGIEEKLSGTGLREAQFEEIFTNKQFVEIFEFIYPKSKNKNYRWDLTNDIEFLNFCNGLFEYKIRSYSETMPIRLANYFYPEFFLPIFNLSHLGNMCRIFGFESKSKEKGERLYDYNKFLNNRLRNVPYPNIIKSHILYKLLYTMNVMDEIDKNGIVNINDFIDEHNRRWIRNTMYEGLIFIKSINLDNE